MTKVMRDRSAFPRRIAGGIGALVLTAGAHLASPLPLAAKPLDADACARLKSERDALEAAGARSALKDQPPPRPLKALDERSRRLSKLIQLDGQLRFRCGMDLPIASLNPELLVDVPDTVEGEAVVKPVPRRPAPKKAKAAPASADQDKSADPVVPAPQRSKSAATKADKATSPTPAAEPQAAKSRPKPKVKVDDSYRPAPKTDSADDQ